MRATAFLHREYEPEYFCAVLRLEPDSQRIMPKNIAHLYVRLAGWEPVFLFERLVIVGWVQLVPREFEYTDGCSSASSSLSCTWPSYSIRRRTSVTT